MTDKEIVKDITAHVLALGLPLLAISHGAGESLADIMVIFFFAWLGLQQGKARSVLTFFTAVLGIFLFRELMVDIISVVPFVWIGLRRGEFQLFILALLTAFGLYFAGSNLLFAAAKGLLFFGLSFVFVSGIKQGWKLGNILLWGFLIGIIYGLLNLFVVGTHPIAAFDLFFKTDLINSTLETYRQTGILQLFENNGLTEAEVKDLLQKGFALLARLFPSLMFINGILVAVGSFLVTRPVLKKGFNINLDIKPFREWTLPWYAVWGGIFAIAAYLSGDYLDLPWMVTAGLNVGMVYFFVCTVLGIAIAMYFLSSPKIPLLIKIVIIFFTMYYLLPTTIMLALFGLFDLVLNFRRIPESM